MNDPRHILNQSGLGQKAEDAMMQAMKTLQENFVKKDLDAILSKFELKIIKHMYGAFAVHFFAVMGLLYGFVEWFIL